MILRPDRALVILLVIVALILTGCQTETDGRQVTAQTTSAAATSTPAQRATRTPARTPTPSASPTPTQPPELAVDLGQLNGVEITFWHPWQGELGLAVELLASEFSQSNEWGIRVRRQPLYSAGELYDAVEAGLASDPPVLPDVVAAPSEHLVAWSSEADIVLNLSGYAGHPQAGFSPQDVAAFQTVFWEQDRLGERQLGIPLLRTARVLFYNQTWARELGFDDPPETPGQFKAQACAAAVANNGLRIQEKFGTGGWLIDTDSLTMLSWLAAFGAQPLPENADGPYQFESEEGEAALAFLRGMLDEGCAWLGRFQTQHDYFAARSALFYSGNLQDIYVQRQLNENLQNEDEWTILPFPGEDGEPVVYTSGYSLALLDPLGGPQDEQSRKERMAGWLFIRWLSQPRNQARLAEALPSIPVSGAVEAQLSDYRQNFPWGMILPLQEPMRPAPGQDTWRTVRRLVEDAAWQIYHLPAEQVNLILPQLDEISQEMLQPE